MNSSWSGAKRTLTGSTTSTRFPSGNFGKKDKAALLELPQYPFSVFRYTTLTVSKTGFATIETNKYGLSPMLAGEKYRPKSSMTM